MLAAWARGHAGWLCVQRRALRAASAVPAVACRGSMFYALARPIRLAARDRADGLSGLGLDIVRVQLVVERTDEQGHDGRKTGLRGQRLGLGELRA